MADESDKLKEDLRNFFEGMKPFKERAAEIQARPESRPLPPPDDETDNMTDDESQLTRRYTDEKIALDVNRWIKDAIQGMEEEIAERIVESFDDDSSGEDNLDVKRGDEILKDRIQRIKAALGIL